jgi:hypothetical protein
VVQTVIALVSALDDSIPTTKQRTTRTSRTVRVSLFMESTSRVGAGVTGSTAL